MGLLETLMWIQIHKIWIRILKFGPIWNLDPGPGFCYQFYHNQKIISDFFYQSVESLNGIFVLFILHILSPIYPIFTCVDPDPQRS